MASSLEKYGWHEWLCKTNFSFLTGASHPHELISRAAEQQYASLCINDFDGAYGLARSFIEHRRLAKSLPLQLPKLHYGAEIHLTKDHRLPILQQETLALVAQNWEGYSNLCHILTLAHKDGKKDACIKLSDLLTKHVEGLIAIQPMRGLMREGVQASHFAPIRDHFNQRFYFVISRHRHPAEDYWIPSTLQIARELGAECLLSQDAFFHHNSRGHLCDLLHSVRHNLSLSEASEHFFPNKERYLHSLASIEARFASLPCYEKSLQTSYELAQSCQFELSALRYHYPQEMIPAGYTAQSFLEDMTWKEAKKRYAIVDAKLSARLTYELKLIAKMNFADYFLTVWDIVYWARSQGILCQGRGSAANSAVCYILGITSVDPNNFDMLFERFISAERGDPPDIDVDFEHERREEVIRYVYERYGRDKAAMVANVITFRRKGALRAVAKSLGIDEGTVTTCAKLCKTKMLRGGGAKEIFEEARKQLEEEQQLSSIPWSLWARLTEELRGFPRHLGIHSGGFMISAKPLNQLVPREPATMEGRTVIQWCKDDIEGLGFFKIDLLCLGMLTAVRKAFSYIKACYGTSLELSQIPHNDSATYSMIQQAETVGTFQIESRAQMTMLPRLRPRCFYDLVIEVAIIRPGPIQGKVINPYLKRRNGIEPVSYPAPVLKPILARTLGVAIFQEQAMRIAVEVGNFTPGEANELRKSIGAWNVKDLSHNLSPYLEKLTNGMRQNNYDEAFIAQIIGQMQGFSDYGFPESHAVSFALIAYASSYLKCHYPAAFFTAILNSQPMGFYSPHSLIQTAKRDGVTVLPICVNHSEWDHQLEALSTNSDQTQASYGIRLGFRLVRSLRKQGASQLVKTRTQEPFSNMEAFLQRTKLVRSDLTALAAANAFHIFGLSRFDAIWISEAAPFHPILEQEEEAFSWPTEDPVGQMERDFAATGTSLGPHPTAIFTQGFWCYQPKFASIHSAEDLQVQKKGCKVSVFGMVLVKQAPPSAKGMVFITIEDASGFINLVFTPQSYAKYYQEIETAFFLCVDGTLQKAGDYRSIMVSKVHARIRPEAQVQRLFDDEVNQQPKTKKEIKDLFEPRNYY
ncbi:MAG: error-prone DNA polymerase [Oligoflexales bacterium]|nr:error-prone DNA polymerase [Oligoflexales bacterium]